MGRTIDLSTCCRTCLRSTCGLIPLDAEDKDSLKFSSKLTACITEIVWMEDKMPSFICEHCVEQLRVSFEFHKVCLTANETLKKYVKQIAERLESKDELFECIQMSKPVEVGNAENPEYLHLKHFLDSDELIKSEVLGGEEQSERSVSPTNSESYMSEYTEAQAIIEVQDIQEIIVQEKDKQLELCIEGDKLDKGEANQPIVIATCNIDGEITPTKENSCVRDKITKNASIQARPCTPDNSKFIVQATKSNTCSVCGKTYKKRANLKEHIRRHTGEKPFQCTICLKRFTIRGELNMHIKSHTGEKPYACNICDRRCLTATDLKVHLRTHTGEKPYSCEFCHKRFSSPYILHSHQKIHTGDRPFLCKVCNKTFTQSSHLNVHMKKHTGEKFVCKLCSAEFKHSSQLTVHKREHTGHQPYKCDLCDKKCNYASELEAHMNKHTGHKFSCSSCKKRFSTQAYLLEHSRVHTGENLFTCKTCNKSFTRQQYLHKHTRTHTGEKPYSCHVCGKNFTQSSSLKVHMRIHTGERPFSCDLCGKSFITPSDLKVHTVRHKKYLDL